MAKENGIDTQNSITISIYPSDDGFGCSVAEPQYAPLTKSFSIALTIAHGMVKMALERPDIVFDEGVDALANPVESDAVVSINDMVKKVKLH
jgi:hypothetical protein|tara:strand:+ start:1279 stop:1554 length:276 start_codon:yes stop_codon:yes gene_type:complete